MRDFSLGLLFLFFSKALRVNLDRRISPIFKVRNVGRLFQLREFAMEH